MRQGDLSSCLYGSGLVWGHGKGRPSGATPAWFFESQEAATVAAELDTLLFTQVSHGNSYLVAYTCDNWPEPKFTGLASHNYAV